MAGFFLSPAFCEHNGVIPLRESQDSIFLGLRNKEDPVLKARIEKAFPEKTFFFEPINEESFKIKLSQLYSEDPSGAFPSDPDRKEKGDLRGSVIDKIETGAPIINLLNSLFLQAVARKASDIHIESLAKGAQVRCRVDGLLLPARTLSSEKAAAVSSRLKLLANLNVLENRRPQDGRLDIRFGETLLDVRISITPTVYGESLVLRLLNRSDELIPLEELGFSQDHLKTLEDIIRFPSGLILLTGPTGSGKTTTLSAILRRLNKPEIKIISIEDPVEYRIDGLTQIQTNEELGLTFDSLLRRIFRQDPDIIMIGEIRDSETAGLAVRAALTGHLVFATLHTNNAREAVFRLRNMDIPGYLIAAVLRAVIAQRLLRRCCISCRGTGCAACSDTGYKGRIVAAEVLLLTPEISEMVNKGAGPEDLKHVLEKTKHKSLYKDAVKKAKTGITDRQEILRTIGSGDD